VSAEAAKQATPGLPSGDGLPSAEPSPGAVRSTLGRVRARLPGGEAKDGASATPTAQQKDGERALQDARRREAEALKRRRDELAQQISQQHWDLGGLAYEMAVRDHFRLDVLVRRAAVLQERDMELAEVERKLSALTGGSTGGGAGGAAAGAAAGGALAAGGATAAAGAAPAKESAKASAMRVGAVLLPLFLGFGVLIGSATAGSGPASRGPTKVVVAEGPPASPTASTPSAESGSGGSGSSSSAGGSGPGSAGGGSGSGGSGGASQAASNSGSSEQPNVVETGSNGSNGSNGSGGSGGSGSGAAKTLPPIKHVFVVMLSDEPYASMFGPESKASYLAHTLEGKGELLVDFYSVAHEELADRVALVSGQGPTPQTAANCSTYADIAPGTVGADQQVLGQGCVYPHATATLASQLAAKHLAWRAYVEGAQAGGAGCQHPTLGANDPTAAAASAGGSSYATFENPFVYFHSVIDASSCGTNDVSLTRLKADLGSAKSTPSLAYIAPDLCHDGGPQPCAPGQPSGPGVTNSFLKSVVGEILASAAYRNDGLLVITTDQAPASGEFADSSACCGQPTFPNVPAATSLAGVARGGGQVGALLISPYVKGGKIQSEKQYNTFSLLRTVEDLFGLKHLGYAGLSGVEALAPALFTAGRNG
jgi:hypothetical protein